MRDTNVAEEQYRQATRDSIDRNASRTIRDMDESATRRTNRNNPLVIDQTYESLLGIMYLSNMLT